MKRMAFRPEYIAALKLLGQAFEALQDRGYGRPVLTGGAAVEFHTGGAVVSGDFDVLTPATRELGEELLKLGFSRPSAGHLMKGWTHPEYEIGVEVVSGQLFDGNADHDKLLLVDLGESRITIVSVEDMIADRLGQSNASPQGVPVFEEQAVFLYKMAQDIDEQYLERRIRTEKLGEYGLSDLKERADEIDND